jgi:hypothetical protein
MKALVSRREMLGLVVALHLACGASVFADETVTPINSVIADPDSFHREFVTLKGTVTKVVLFRGNDGTNRPLCIQEFTLKDETGSIGVLYSSLCQMGDEKAMILAVGDSVLVEAIIDSPPDNIKTYKGGEYGVTAQARKVTPLEK